MRKVVTLVGLALATVFAVAAGDNEIELDQSISTDNFKKAASYGFARSVTLTVDGQPIVNKTTTTKSLSFPIIKFMLTLKPLDLHCRKYKGGN